MLIIVQLVGAFRGCATFCAGCLAIDYSPYLVLKLDVSLILRVQP